MATLSGEAMDNFIAVCHWAYEACTTQRVLFDDNSQIEELMQSRYGPFLQRLSVITSEYALLQISKLHDSVKKPNRKNLTIAYVMAHDWDDETARSLQDIHGRLDALYQRIKPARNKILAHSDWETIQAGNPLGEFDKDADREYFENLAQFIGMAQGVPFEFGSFPHNDAITFVEGLSKLLGLS